jgi:hypothetical protein
MPIHHGKALTPQVKLVYVMYILSIYLTILYLVYVVHNGLCYLLDHLFPSLRFTKGLLNEF